MYVIMEMVLSIERALKKVAGSFSPFFEVSFKKERKSNS